LDEGFDQLYAAGRLWRDYIVETARLLPKGFDPDLIRIQSSFADRALESAAAFMEGLYPPQSEGEILNITTGSPAFDVLVPGLSGPDRRALTKQFALSEAAAPRLKRAIETYTPILEVPTYKYKYLQVPHLRSLQHIVQARSGLADDW
jgi:acid phosphatase